jgi:hypothetical protein
MLEEVLMTEQKRKEVPAEKNRVEAEEAELALIKKIKHHESLKNTESLLEEAKEKLTNN